MNHACMYRSNLLQLSNLRFHHFYSLATCFFVHKCDFKMSFVQQFCMSKYHVSSSPFAVAFRVYVNEIVCCQHFVTYFVSDGKICSIVYTLLRIYSPGKQYKYIISFNFACRDLTERKRVIVLMHRKSNIAFSQELVSQSSSIIPRLSHGSVPTIKCLIIYLFLKKCIQMVCILQKKYRLNCGVTAQESIQSFSHTHLIP